MDSNESCSHIESRAGSSRNHHFLVYKAPRPMLYRNKMLWIYIYSGGVKADGLAIDFLSAHTHTHTHIRVKAQQDRETCTSCIFDVLSTETGALTGLDDRRQRQQQQQGKKKAGDNIILPGHNREFNLFFFPFFLFGRTVRG